MQACQQKSVFFQKKATTSSLCLKKWEPMPRDRTAQERFQRELLSFIEKRLPGKRLAQAVLQELVLRIQVRGRLLPASENVSSWLYRLTRNTILDYAKAEGLTCAAPLPEEGYLPSAPDGLEALQEAHLEFYRALLPLLEDSEMTEAEQKAIECLEWKDQAEEEFCRESAMAPSRLPDLLYRARGRLLEALLSACRWEWNEDELIALQLGRTGLDSYC